MADPYRVPLKDLADKFGLEVLFEIGRAHV